MTRGAAAYRTMFDGLKAKGEGAFGGFVVIGDPDLEISASILDALVEGGADMLEVGIPFSDPVADGPTIQAAADRALTQSVTPADCFALLAAFRKRHPHVPVGILTYANIVLARGKEAFFRACAGAGVDSVLIADVPAFEGAPFADAARREGIATVMIAAATTPSETLERIAELSEGYTYCVTRVGVTGTETGMQLDHFGLLGNLATFGAPPPVLGFGISTPDHVWQALGAGAVGVISGSAIVKLIEANPADPTAAIRAFVTGMKAGTRA